MKKWKERNLFLPLVSFDEKTLKTGTRRMAFNVHEAQSQKGWNIEKEERCILAVIEGINALRNHYVLHQDVHLKNVVCNKSFTKFYLIDFDVSVKKPFSSMNVYEKKSYLYREDQFQLFWNFIFGHNKFISDFTSFRKRVRRHSTKTKDLLKKSCKIFFIKSYLDEMWEIFLSEEPIQLKGKENKIVFKFFLTRLYLLYDIHVRRPNLFYQSLVRRVQW